MEVINSSSVAKSEAIDRPLADFPVNIWEDPMTSFSVSDMGSERTKDEKLNSLKETVKDSFMASKEKPIENINFIDALCRLGVVNKAHDVEDMGLSKEQPNHKDFLSLQQKQNVTIAKER